MFYFGSVRRPLVLAYRHVKSSDLVKITCGGQSVAGTLDEKGRVSLERPLDYGTPFEVTYAPHSQSKGS